MGHNSVPLLLRPRVAQRPRRRECLSETTTHWPSLLICDSLNGCAKEFVEIAFGGLGGHQGFVHQLAFAFQERVKIFVER